MCDETKRQDKMLGQQLELMDVKFRDLMQMHQFAKAKSDKHRKDVDDWRQGGKRATKVKPPPK